MTSAQLPTASIIINTLNRGAYLNDAIRALHLLDYLDFEIIVVNGPSTDNTAEVLAGWAGRIKSLECAEANLSVSRNVGIEAAAGEIICFVDDDAAPHPQWLKRLAAIYADPMVGGVGGFTIDNTGVQWQVRKTICDRLGNAYNPSDFFDERPLNRSGSPFYPSLLGTNSSFRASALRLIGGFDHAFAYLLDETDVCLRLVDAGWKVLYEPTAVVYHQFAPSHIRSPARVPRTLRPSATSKGYFVMRHGAAQSLTAAAEELDRYLIDIARANKRLADEGQIDARHHFVLDSELREGVAAGRALAMRNADKALGDLKAVAPPPLHRVDRAKPLRLAIVTQGYPPDTEAGIARWSSLIAHGLAARGHEVHVLTRSTTDQESVSFVGGLWLHRLRPDDDEAAAIAASYDLPGGIAAWCARCWRELQSLKSFGVDLVSFPIWDLEALPMLDDPDIAAVLSLHTTYAMAKPFKPEWNARPIYEHHMVNRMIAAERRALARAPTILANSQVIIDEIASTYGVMVADRATIVPHATDDALIDDPGAAERRAKELLSGAPVRVLFVGRFEPRKGFDIAAELAARMVKAGMPVSMRFIGDTPNDANLRLFASLGVPDLIEHPAIEFAGVVDREALNRAYIDADILIAPSRFESFGLIGIEAFSAATPVLALAAGGLTEVIDDGRTGRLFADTPAAAEQMFAEVKRLDGDRKALTDMARQARASFEARYTIAKMIDGVEAVYRQARAQVHGELNAA